MPCHTKELFALASQRVREGQLKCFQLVVHTPTSDQKRWEDASSRFLSEGEADEDKKEKKEKKKKEEGADIIKEAQKRQNKKKMAEHTSLIAQQHPLALPHHKFMGPAIPCSTGKGLGKRTDLPHASTKRCAQSSQDQGHSKTEAGSQIWEV